MRFDGIRERFKDFLTLQKALTDRSADEYVGEIERLYSFSGRDLLSIKSYSELSGILIELKKQRNHSDRTTYKLASMLKMYLDFCVLHNFVESPHPFQLGHGFKKGRSPEPDFFDRNDADDKEIISLLLWNPNVKISLRDRVILWTLYATGLRRSELVALDYDDVNLKERLLHIRHGKGDKWRYVSFCQESAQWLEIYCQAVAKYAEKGPIPLFSTDSGDRLSSATIYKILAKVGTQLELPAKINPHKWRHSLASFLVQHMDISVTAKQMGHTDIQTTFRYTHLRPKSVQKHYDRAVASLV